MTHKTTQRQPFHNVDLIFVKLWSTLILKQSPVMEQI